MKFKAVRSAADLKRFYRAGRDVYREMPCHRSTEDDVMKLLVEGPTAFHEHADVHSFVIERDGHDAGRFSLIRDRRADDYVMVSFFEAQPGLAGVADGISALAKEAFPECTSIVFGINGHLNYGAGFLLSRYDEVPLFGLPYTPGYYTGYFDGLEREEMHSFRYSHSAYKRFRAPVVKRLQARGITLRTMNMKNLKRDVELYTRLNNECFRDHPYWADRSPAEDFELFHPFRFLLKRENLIFAEDAGKPVGFLLWYPDFNELVRDDGSLGLKHVLAYRFLNRIRSYRLTEIAVLPEYAGTPVAMAMIVRLQEYLDRCGMEYGEGGFIFESNTRSINLVSRCIVRGYGEKLEPYRRYAVYRGML